MPNKYFRQCILFLTINYKLAKIHTTSFPQWGKTKDAANPAIPGNNLG